MVVSTVASQEEVSELNSTTPGSFCVEFASSLQVLWLPPSVQRHGVRHGHSKLPIGVNGWRIFNF